MNTEGKCMTVQEFYEWCVKRGITYAEMRISLKFAGLDMKDVPVTWRNIDYGVERTTDSAFGKRYVRIGG